MASTALRRLPSLLAATCAAATVHRCSPPSLPDPHHPAVVRVQRPNTATLDRAHEDPASMPRRALYDTAVAMYGWEMDTDPEVGWRVARAAHQLAMAPGTPAAERLALLERAFHLITEAKSHLRSNGAVYRWSGIILSDLSALQGTKASIEAAFDVHDDWREALTLDPDDASAHHLLGRWCFRIVRFVFSMLAFAAFYVYLTTLLSSRRRSWMVGLGGQPPHFMRSRPRAAWGKRRTISRGQRSCSPGFGCQTSCGWGRWRRRCTSTRTLQNGYSLLA